MSEHSANLARLHWPVTSLGYGKRIGIWFQGCSIGCKGCCAQDTWAVDPSTRTSIRCVLEWIARQPVEEVDGFTISGGEPFEQPEALSVLVSSLRALPPFCTDRDILVYSGLPWRKLQRTHADVIGRVDVVISEPFVAHRPGTWLRGSDNQEIRLLSDLARVRYGPTFEKGLRAPHLQIHYDGKRLWMIGIPRSGDLARMEAKLQGSGISLRSVSWRG